MKTFWIGCNGLEECVVPDLKVGQMVKGILGAGGSQSGNFVVCGIAGNKVELVEIGGRKRLIKEYIDLIRPIEKVFGIGFYYYDKFIIKQQDIENYIKEAKEEEKRQAKEKERQEKEKEEKKKQLLKQYDFLTDVREMNYKDKEKATKKNLKELLKKTFPKQKFEIRKIGRDWCDVWWIDGVAAEEVRKITCLFRCASYDAYKDVRVTEKNIFADVFGGWDYITVSRATKRGR